MHFYLHFSRALVRTVLSFPFAISLSSLRAEETPLLDALVVQGRAADLVGTAGAASSGSVGYVELAARPFLRRGELLEVIPGVVITQHSGGGKANQYFLRGFTLDHGTDFAISVDGMPVNLRTHAHGQGYSDLNFIIPEFVQSVDYTKGPFAAEVGDFSAAGAASFKLFNALPQAFAKIEGGENGYARLVAGESVLHADSALTTVGFEVARDDGPWTLKENLRRISGLARHTWSDSPSREFSLTALGYRAEWRSTDQIPQRAIDTGAIDRFGNIDPTDGGKTERASLSLAGSLQDADAITRFNAYAIYYRLNLFSNFSFFLEDPVNGDQFNQRDRRAVFGASLEREWTTEKAGRNMKTSLGIQVREDLIGEVSLRHTNARMLVNNVRTDEVNEGSVGVFAKNTTQWSRSFRTETGLRGDVYSFQVDSDNARNSGRRTAGIVSPKLGWIFGPWAKTEIYLNAGLGFHSNDARGTTIGVDPADGVTPVDRVDPLVRSRGMEAGVRTSAVSGLVSTVSLWFLDLDSELVFVGDAGGTEASGASRRYGVEFANFYRATPWLTFDGDVSFTHARYRDNAPDDKIANSIGTVVTAGVALGRTEGVFCSARIRYFGRQPLVEDDSVQEPSSTTANARVGWRNRQWEVAVDVLNVFNRANDDIAYFYASRLPGEPLEGIADRHFHPAEPRTMRFSVTRKF